MIRKAIAESEQLERDRKIAAKKKKLYRQQKKQLLREEQIEQQEMMRLTIMDLKDQMKDVERQAYDLLYEDANAINDLEKKLQAQRMREDREIQRQLLLGSIKEQAERISLQSQSKGFDSFKPPYRILDELDEENGNIQASCDAQQKLAQQEESNHEAKKARIKRLQANRASFRQRLKEE